MARPRTTNKHLPRYVTVIHGSYWFRPPCRAAARVCKVGDMAALYKFLATNAEPVGELRTLADCFDKYIREIVPTKKAVTQKLYLKCLTTLRPVFGSAAPDDVKPRDVGRFLAAGDAPVMRNREVAVLSAVYSKCVGKWYCADRNPCDKVERNEERPRTRYVTDAELKAFVATLPESVGLAFEIAHLTAQRESDILAAEWEDIKDGHWHFMPGKSSKLGKRLAIRITPTLQGVIDRCKRLKPDLPRRHIIRKPTSKGNSRAGQRYTLSGFTAIWQRYMVAAIERGILAERFTFHDIRAKGISDAGTLQAGFELSGHSSIALTRGTYDRGIRKVEPTK